MKYLSIIFLFLIAFVACKKDEPADLCKNGFKDVGEVGVDCGGNCDPCIMTYSPNFFLKVNGIPITFETNSITQLNNTWYLACSNDSVQLQFNIGPDISVGNYNISPSNTFAVVNGINYPFIVPSSAVVGIYENFTADHRLSGLFQTKFYRTGFVDTVFVSSGEFVHTPY